MPTPARTSLEAIVAAGRAVLEAEGLEALTMQRVADAVGVRPPSLYKRVRGRDELVRLVVTDVGRDLAATIRGAVRSGDPARDLDSLARAYRAFAHAHPRAYGLVFGPLPTAVQPELAVLAPANEAVLEVAAALAGADRALDGARMIVAWASGFVSMELAGGFRLGGDVDEAFAFGIDRLRIALAANERGPSVVSGRGQVRPR
jgi:AcrR family transcriptional regulator